MTLGRLAFALLFCVVIPVGLVAFARVLDARIALPAPHAVAAGWLVAALGGALMAWATIELKRAGDGLPMSPYPPARQVRSGPYAVFANPIYVGAVVVGAGCSIAAGSGAGLWIVTPMIALACAAMVYGYERTGLVERFGALHAPALKLAAGAESPIGSVERIATHAVVFVPWAIAICGAAHLPAPDAVESRMPFEQKLAWSEFAALVWVLSPLLALGAPVAVRDRTDLRRLQTAGVVGLALFVVLRLAVPLKTVPPEADVGGMIGGLVDFVRAWDSGGLGAFGAWRVFWAFVAAGAVGLSYRGMRYVLYPLAVGVGAAGVMSGFASIADVASGFVLFMIAWHAQRLWLATLRRMESIANMWVALEIGSVRVLIHALYAGLAASVGIVVASALIGPAMHPALAAVSGAGLIGAFVWARALEGGKLSRPFGYFGHVIGTAIALGGVAVFVGRDEAWRLSAACATMACVVQPIGRLRCLVQGCCHGRPCEGLSGIHHEDHRSRVAKFTEWKGRALYPTAVYSMVSGLVMFALLLRLYSVGGEASWVVGAYLALGGLARFVEEHYRGEPQTRFYAGLRVYQWLSAACVVVGLGVMMIETPRIAWEGEVNWLVAAAVGVVYAFAMGVEWPRGEWRGARLS